jgi:hypothetical protein
MTYLARLFSHHQFSFWVLLACSGTKQSMLLMESKPEGQIIAVLLDKFLTITLTSSVILFSVFKDLQQLELQADYYPFL